jgi:hypothetical protein
VTWIVTWAPERHASAACWMIPLPSAVIVSLSQSKNTRNTLRGGGGGGGGAATAGAGANNQVRLATTLLVLVLALYVRLGNATPLTVNAVVLKVASDDPR